MIGPTPIGIPEQEGTSSIVVTNLGLNIESIDYGTGNHGLQVAQAEIIQGIQGIGQTIVKILLRGDARQQDIQNRGLFGKLANPVQLHHLEENSGNHGDASLSVRKDFSPRVSGHMFIHDIDDAAFVEIMGQNRRESKGFGVDVVDGYLGHGYDLRKIWRSWYNTHKEKSSLIYNDYR